MPDADDIVIEMSPDGSYDCTPEAFRRLSMKGQKANLKRGTKVLIQGLKSKPELNGQTAVVKTFSYDKGRYTVAIDKSGQTLALKEANLEKISPIAEREQAIAKAKAKRAEVEKNVAKAKADQKAQAEAKAKAEEEANKKQSTSTNGLGKGFDEDGEFHEESLMNSDDEDETPEPAVEPAPESPAKKKKKKKKKNNNNVEAIGLDHTVTITNEAVVIAIELSATTVTSMAELSLDVFEEKLNLHQISSNSLLLAVPLTEKVDPDAAAAKFSKKKRRLTVTVPKL